MSDQLNEKKSKKEIFREVNERKRMEKVYKYLSPSTSFEDLKKHSEEFQDITARLKEETRKRKDKKELRKKRKEIQESPYNDVD